MFSRSPPADQRPFPLKRQPDAMRPGAPAPAQAAADFGPPPKPRFEPAGGAFAAPPQAPTAAAAAPQQTVSDGWKPEPWKSAPPQGAEGAASGFTLGSIIGNDLTIVGQGLRIITRGTLQVDGKVDGDVVGMEVVVGERGCVTGVVSAETVAVRGRVNGTIRGATVTLHSSAHVEGDVHHKQLAIEEGAHLDGSVRRPANPSDLEPDFGGI